MNRKLIVIAGIVAFVALLGMAGQMDFEDAKAEEALYCDNVKNGVWPDYDGIYADVCEAEYGKAKKVKKKYFDLTA